MEKTNEGVPQLPVDLWRMIQNADPAMQKTTKSLSRDFNSDEVLCSDFRTYDYNDWTSDNQWFIGYWDTLKASLRAKVLLALTSKHLRLRIWTGTGLPAELFERVGKCLGPIIESLDVQTHPYPSSVEDKGMMAAQFAQLLCQFNPLRLRIYGSDPMFVLENISKSNLRFLTITLNRINQIWKEKLSTVPWDKFEKLEINFVGGDWIKKELVGLILPNTFVIKYDGELKEPDKS